MFATSFSDEDCARLCTSVGSREGGAATTLRWDRVLIDVGSGSSAKANALEAAVVLVAASLGILFGPCRKPLIGDSGGCTDVLAATDLVTRVLAGALDGAPREVGTALIFRAGGATPSSGRTSADSSSSSES